MQKRGTNSSGSHRRILQRGMLGGFGIDVRTPVQGANYSEKAVLSEAREIISVLRRFEYRVERKSLGMLECQEVRAPPKANTYYMLGIDFDRFSQTAAQIIVPVLYFFYRPVGTCFIDSRASLSPRAYS